jgi:hypothetical protein
MDLLLWKVVAIVLLAFSLFGLAHGLVFRNHGPAFDLFVVAGALSAAAFYYSRRIATDR